MNKGKLIVVAYQFPPLNTIGAMRPYKLVKGILDNHRNVDIHVVRLAPKSYGKVYDNYSLNDFDQNLKSEGLYVHDVESDDIRLSGMSRVKGYLSTFFNVFRGREYKGWEDSLEACLDGLIKDGENTQIVVSCPPFSIGWLVHRFCQKHRLKYVLDMRDAWSLWCDHPYPTIIHYWMTKRCERKMIYSASEIVCVTCVQSEDFQHQHPGVSASKFVVIPNSFKTNGYVQSELDKLSYMGREDILISYAGSFYYDENTHAIMRKKWYQRKPWQFFYYVPRVENWKYRTPYYFFKIVEKIKKSAPDIYQKISVHFAGGKPPWFDRMVARFELEDKVVHEGFLSQDQLADFYGKSDMFLATSAKNSHGKDYCLAGKTFDYVAYGKPILSVAPEGEQRDFVLKTKTGLALNPDAPVKAAAQFVEFLSEPHIKVDMEELEMYSQERFSKNWLTLLALDER